METQLLRPHQHQPVQHLLKIFARFDSALDLSDTGTGKTYVASAVASQLNIPTLVVCPKIAVSQWRAAAHHFLDSFSIVGWELLRTGKTAFGKWKNPLPGDREERECLKCLNCQQVVTNQRCYAHHLGIHCVEIKKKRWNYGPFTFAPEVKFVIFDEIHRAAGDSLNGDMVIAAKRAKKKVLGLSATPACNPGQMRALGCLMDLHRLTDYYGWAARHGWGKLQQLPGLRWRVGEERQRNIMIQIRDSIIPTRGVRVTIDSIPGFPERTITAELYDLPKKDTAELNQLYSQVRGSLEILHARAALDKDPELAVTKLLRARQEIELLKVPIAEELGRDYLAKGCSVVWFVNYRQTIEELKKRFPNAGVIQGDNTDTRDSVVEAFQSNRNRELIVNSFAGGICLSLHDLFGGFPRVGLVMPCDSAVTLRQLFGRLARDGGRSPAFYRVIFAAGTDEEKMQCRVSKKLNNLDALIDADLEPGNLSV